MLEILKAVLFGIIEGVTEWLPISSTGHMILLDEFVHLGVSAEFYKLFEVVIQLGAILAVILLYFEKIWPLKRIDGSLTLDRPTLDLWGKIIAACLPAAVIGILFDDWMEEHFFTPEVVAITLILYGLRRPADRTGTQRSGRVYLLSGYPRHDWRFPAETGQIHPADGLCI